MGIFARSLARTSSGIAAIISVSMNPGAIALIVTPFAGHLERGGLREADDPCLGRGVSVWHYLHVDSRCILHLATTPVKGPHRPWEQRASEMSHH
jgi:hypothetical protein